MNSKSIIAALVVLSGCMSPEAPQDSKKNAPESSFIDDVTFLRKYTPILILEEKSGKGKVAVSQALQGRVMTSSADGDAGSGFGWINRKLFESRDTTEHINAFGGEERIWLGPEGGQFSIFFEKGKEFNLDNWFTPRLIDLESFDLLSSDKSSARFTKTAQLTNYSGTTFKIKIDREITVLESANATEMLGAPIDPDLKAVAFRTVNTLSNIDNKSWNKNTGVLSIWLLGMLKPSPYTTIIIPFNAGMDEKLGPIVNDTYFGKVPAERLIVNDGVIFFNGDGKYRSKIGLSPSRAKDVMGSYDSKAQMLTIVKYNKPTTTDYVNSAWEIQDHPYKGDVINSYNDGPPSPGAEPMGPFYELESSSPAQELRAGESIIHTQTTFHFQGNEKALDKLSIQLLGVSLDRIKNAFAKQTK